MKFLHTSDWQIGMKADSVGLVAERVREERLEAAKRLVQIAREQGVEFIVLAGDIFEDNAVDRLLVRKVGEILRAFAGPVYLIPGNHDPLTPGSVWEHGVWKESANLTVLRKAHAHEREDCTLFPCPLTEKYSTKDPTAWIDARNATKPAIGLAHGNVEGIVSGEPDYPIPRNAAEMRGLDYLALGHWHSFARYDDAQGICHMAYSGTHETTKFGERDSGNTLIVEIAGRGSPPKLTPIKTGRLDWRTIEQSVDHPQALEALVQELEKLKEPDLTLVRVQVAGVLFPESRASLVRIEELLASRFLFGILDASRLIPAPDGESWIESLPAGAFRETALKLRSQATQSPDPRATGRCHRSPPATVCPLGKEPRMILHNLSVRHWRSLLQPVEWGPFSERLNVIHAPNGAGKSSLFEAMRRTLFDAHQVTGKEIEAVRPWGRSLAPQVQLEFTQAGVRYRVEKTFLDGAGAHLLRFEDGKFQPLADSRNADTQLREILAASAAPGRGLSKQEHWGMAQVLWAPQGALCLESLSPDVTQNLRATLGVQLIGEAGSRLEELLEEHYQTYFTNKSGKVRTGKDGAPILTLERGRAATAAERERRLERHRQFEEAARMVEDARQRRGQARHEADALRESVLQTRQQLESYQRLQGELEQKRQAESAAKERYESVGQTLALIRQSREEITALQAQIQNGLKLTEALAAELKPAAEALANARREREESRRRRSCLDQRSAEIEDAHAFLADTKARQTLTARIGKLGQLATDLQAHKQQRTALVAPEEKTVRDEVRKCLTAADQAQAALNASLIHLTVRTKQKAIVTRQSPDEQRIVPAEEAATFSGSPEVQIEIQGFGTIHASGPEGNCEAHQKGLQEATKKLAKLTQPFGTQDPDQLQLLRDQANQLDQKIQILEGQITELLDKETADELHQQLAELDARILERLGRFPNWKKHPPVISDLQAALESQRQAIETAIEQAEGAFDTVQATVRAVETRQAEQAVELKNARLNLEAATGRLADLTKDGQSDEARAHAQQEFLMAWEAARTQAKECEKKLEEIPGDPQKTLQKLQLQFTALEAAEAAARDEEKQAEGRLQTLAAEGTYSQLAACEETIADLDTRIRREKRRMEAARLLYQTATACKAALVAAVAAPVERAASRMLSRIAGSRLGSVCFTDGFVPTGIRPELATETVELTNLSGGEQEQLFLITRLALGQVLAKAERQLVVLDDVLNATDTGRLARLLTLLEEAAESLQILILTCHPERYRALEKAEFFDLQKLAQPGGMK